MIPSAIAILLALPADQRVEAVTQDPTIFDLIGKQDRELRDEIDLVRRLHVLTEQQTLDCSRFPVCTEERSKTEKAKKAVLDALAIARLNEAKRRMDLVNARYK